MWCGAVGQLCASRREADSALLQYCALYWPLPWQYCCCIYPALPWQYRTLPQYILLYPAPALTCPPLEIENFALLY